MDLPVAEWKSYLLQKWSLLPKSIQVTVSTAETLSDVFLQSSSLLQPEDEIFLKRLSKGYFVGKDSGAPLFYREEGNKKFQEKDYTVAAVLYSKGVSHSRPNTEDMSLCYANRSAALFHLGQYETCLKDIIRAQTHGYPERLQPKIMLRKAECLVALGRLQEARRTISDLERNFPASPTLADFPSQSVQRNLHHLKMKVQEKENLPETFPAALAKTLEGVDLGEENKQLSNASSSVGLCMDPLKGRCLVATREILPGEPLVKEDAFVSVLNPGELPPLHHSLDSKWDTRVTNGDLYCHRCLKHTLATVPCDGCSYAKYCSQECLRQAWELYHRIECPLGGLLLTLGVFCHIALRLTLLVGFEDVSKIRKLCDEVSNKDIYLPESNSRVKTLNSGLGEIEKNGKIVETPIPGCDVNGKYESNYQAVFNLLPHTENHSPEHKFLCALCVSALCRQLEAASFQAVATGADSSRLKAAAAPELCPDVTVWGVAMLRHMLQLQCNAQAITTIQHTGSKEGIVTGSRQVRLATGIFPVISLLNHSCSPNTSVSFISTIATIQASQRIGKGQEIVHCYGPHKSRMGVAERQQKLRSQYFFDCTCPACHTEVHEMAARPRWEAFCCNSCRAPMQGDDVLSCGRRGCAESVRRDHLASRLQDLRQQVGMAQKLLSDGELEPAIQQLLGCQRDAKSFLSAEHAVLGEIEDGLAQACAALGDWQKSATHLQNSLRVVEARHGPSSVEMGHELFKLAQIFFNGFAVPEALSTIRKAEEVLSLHCGPWDDEIQELQKMKSCLLDLTPSL
ncbi:SET and MYND domain-containing protein 4 isoform X1 [Sapajus apella]|uniref:Protein-lysine N-methyltransferase SMYD4 n=2 Tax=Sapajus apella TaxID=9515 RepID=A0A6J3GN64_SAPAP|nr:SET and MYND domain-containing protein 4 isoform X1 [Sapajus apella]XP_032119325.1 SET and MYND domain-containing protein 4 isoform X1 [Sapajus apella]